MSYLYYCIFAFVSTAYKKAEDYHYLTRYFLTALAVMILMFVLDITGTIFLFDGKPALLASLTLAAGYFATRFYYVSNDRGEKIVDYYLEKRSNKNSLDASIGILVLIFGFISIFVGNWIKGFVGNWIKGMFFHS